MTNNYHVSKPVYTKKQKQILIDRFKEQTAKHVLQMHQRSDELVGMAEQQVLRRLNSVSATLWNVKIKDVLQIERHHKPTVRNLLRDIKAMEDKSLFQLENPVFFSGSYSRSSENGK